MSKKYNFISKKLLIQKYIINKKSILQISKEIMCSRHAIYDRLKKYHINIRIANKTTKQYYCIKCHKKIHYITACYRNKRCISCSLKKRFENPKNHPNYINGASLEKYGKDFTPALKDQIRFKDRYKCQLCGCPQIENLKQLDVHHIDYDKKNNNINNLISLCVICHRKTNYNREFWTNYFKKIMIIRRAYNETNKI